MVVSGGLWWFIVLVYSDSWCWFMLFKVCRVKDNNNLKEGGCNLYTQLLELMDVVWNLGHA